MATKIGTGGDDTIIGTKFKDLLFGKGGDDRIFGNGAADKINGGNGNDKMTGDAGADRFVFGNGSGRDIITDFSVGDDILQIKSGVNGSTITDGASALANAVQKGDDVVIKLGDGNTIKLKNVNLGDLTADDFDIV